MSFGKRIATPIVALMITFVAGFWVTAQEPNAVATETENKNLDTPSGAFLQIKSLTEEGKWESAAKLMTKQAADETAAGVVTLALSVTAVDVPISIPQLDDAKLAIAEALELHGLDKLDIRVEPAFKVKLGGFGDEAGDEADDEVPVAEVSPKTESDKSILAALDRSGKRWSIVEDVGDAIGSTPFGQHSLSGSVIGEQVDGNHATLKVKHDPAKQNERGGMMVHVQGPPRFLKFVKQDGSWKFAGIDVKKTAAARKAFSPETHTNENDY